MSVLIGLCVAVSFGSGDFLGGLASRRASTLAVLCFAQSAALVGAVVVALAVGGHVSARDVGLSVAAGLLNVAALGSLYRGLAIGEIGQVAPVAAVVGASLPVAWGLVNGERPSAVALVGVGLAVVAGALVSREREEQRGPLFGRALPLAVAAGVGFGTSLILFAEASHHSGFWPVLCARTGALVAVFVVARASGTVLTMPTGSRRQAVTAGFLDVTGTTLLLMALRRGLIATVAPVAALAPGVTVAHAWWYLREKVAPVQIVGLGVGLVGLVLIAIG